MFRGETGGKINEGLKDGRKKSVDSSVYKKPGILEEKDKEKVIEFKKAEKEFLNFLDTDFDKAKEYLIKKDEKLKKELEMFTQVDDSGVLVVICDELRKKIDILSAINKEETVKFLKNLFFADSLNSDPTFESLDFLDYVIKEYNDEDYYEDDDYEFEDYSIEKAHFIPVTIDLKNFEKKDKDNNKINNFKNHFNNSYESDEENDNEDEDYKTHTTLKVYGERRNLEEDNLSEEEILITKEAIEKNKNIPPLFSTNKETDFGNYKEDVFFLTCDGDERVYNYRTFYYDIIFDKLKDLDSGSNVVDCLKRFLEMDKGYIKTTETKNSYLKKLEKEFKKDTYKDWEESFMEDKWGMPFKTLLGFFEKNPKFHKEVSVNLLNNLENSLILEAEHFYKIIEIFNQNPSFVSGLLLEKIKQSKINVEKTLLTRFLYHLEFGKIGMSEEGIKYLDKTFDLGSDNSSQGFAHRATGDGKVAIFDDDNKIKGYFELSNLDSDEKTVKTQMHQITYETLFYPQKNETEEQKQEREKILEEFKEKYFSTYLDKSGEFYKKTGVAFNNLGFKEQGMFLNFVSQANEEDKNRALGFIKKHKENGFTAFLTMQADLDDGEKIIQIGEKIEEKKAEKIFALISNYLKWVEKKNEEISEEFFNNKNNQDFISFREKLLKKAHEIISSFAKVINEKNTKEETKKLFGELDNSKTELVVLGFALKDAKEKGIKISLNELKNTSLDIKNVLDEKEEEEILKIAEQNSQNREFDDKVVLHSLQEALKNSKNKFYLLKNKDKIVSFLRLEEMEDKSLYFGSFNTDIDAQGAGLGNSFMERTLDEVSKDHVIKANVEVENPVAQNYVNQRNFVITNILRDVANTKVDGFDIMRDENKAKEVLKTKEYTNKEEFFAEAQDRLKSGEVITGYVLPTKNNPVFKITYGKLIEKTNQV